MFKLANVHCGIKHIQFDLTKLSTLIISSVQFHGVRQMQRNALSQDVSSTLHS